MGDYLKLFETHSEYEAYSGGGEMLKPNVSYCEDNNEVHYNPIPDYSQEYLTFVAKEAGTFTCALVNNNVVSYSIDNGSTWIAGNSSSGATSVEVSSGGKVLWKGEMTPNGTGSCSFSSTTNFDVQGNVMSLLYGDNFKGKVDLTGKNYAFYWLFYQNTKLVNAENLSLPATTLADYCYQNMFSGCTALATAPKLPATTLANYCYSNMFINCRLLTTAPELPATTLVSKCYAAMFAGCTKLNYIKAMFTTAPSTDYTSNWVSGVATTGTFVKNSAATWNVTGTNGIPTGWTVETASA